MKHIGMPIQTQNATAGTEIVKPDHPVKDGDVIKTGGLTFRVYNNDKAHTDTDIMVLVEENEIRCRRLLSHDQRSPYGGTLHQEFFRYGACLTPDIGNPAESVLGQRSKPS